MTTTEAPPTTTTEPSTPARRDPLPDIVTAVLAFGSAWPLVWLATLAHIPRFALYVLVTLIVVWLAAKAVDHLVRKRAGQ